MRLAAVDDELDVAADHQRREVLLVGLRRQPLADDLAAPDDRDPVRDLEDLVQLVADEDDAVALLGEPPQDREDLLGLLGREDGGRLVEDEDPGVAVERLEDLDPLLPADRQVADLDVGVDLEPEPLAELDDPALAPPSGRGRPGCAIVSSPRRMFSATVRTGTSMKCWWTMLIPRLIASVGLAIRTAVPSMQDLALVRPGQAVEDVHQRRLAGAVLAEQGVDLAGPDVEVDVVVGDDARVALGDARASRAPGAWTGSSRTISACSSRRSCVSSAGGWAGSTVMVRYRVQNAGRPSCLGRPAVRVRGASSIS